jgi:CHAD domain-containing protein
LPEPVGAGDPTRCVVRDVLRRNVRALITHDVQVRRDLPDAVHQMRVNARRIRSALKTFADILDPEWSESLRIELKWLADALAGARDNEVLLDRLLGQLRALPESLIIGPVEARITKVVGGSLETGSGQALETLRSERYVVLLERLVDAAWEPMTAPAAEEPIGKAVPPLIQEAWKKLARRAGRLEQRDATAEDWHQTRIAAKQLRYSCDAVEPTFGKPAKALSKQAAAIQDVLGEHQDAVIAADTLRALATGRGGGSVAFTLGLLHARQTDAAAASRADFRRAWAKGSRSRYRRWLST